MKKTKLIRDIVSTKVEAVKPSHSVLEAARSMKRAGVGALPVIDGETLVGIITDRDIVLRAVAEARDLETSKVGDAMSTGLICCNTDDTVKTAAELMEREQVRRLVVKEPHSGGAVGIVSLGDVTRAASDMVAAKAIKRVSATA